jgi:hypothetical protein
MRGWRGVKRVGKVINQEKQGRGFPSYSSEE